MKKLIAVCLLLLLAVAMAGCGDKNPGEPDTPNARIPSIMYNGEFYGTTGKQMPVEIDEQAYAGRICSTVPLSELPREEGQANFGEVGTPYASIPEGLVVLMNNEWTLFEIIEIVE